MVKVRLSDNDKQILHILYKLPYATSEHLALLLDEPISYITRRCIQLKEAGLIGREYLVGGVLAYNYLKKKGMRLAGLPYRNVTKPKLYNYEHNLGEIQMYLTFVLNPRFPVKFGQIITERDILNSVIWDENGLTKTGTKKLVARDVSMGIHRPDGYIIMNRNGQQYLVALEYERSRKSIKSNSDLLTNLESNAKRFDKQYWFCDGKQVSNKVNRTKNNSHLAQIVDHQKAVQNIGRQVDKLPAQVSTKEGRTKRDFIGEYIDPIPLSEIPMKNIVQLE